MHHHLQLPRWATLGVLAFAASATFAEPALTRADVSAQTLSARAAGQLVPAGEGIETRGATYDRGAALTRSAVMADVRAARAAGQLIAAGEGAGPATLNVSTGPVLARAAVKADVISARASGDLVPAGEGLVPEALQRSRAAAAWMAKAKTRGVNPNDTARAQQANTATSPQ